MGKEKLGTLIFYPRLTRKTLCKVFAGIDFFLRRTHRLCHSLGWEDMQSSMILGVLFADFIRNMYLCGQITQGCVTQGCVTQGCITRITLKINILRAISAGVHEGFSTAANREEYNLGSYSNIARIKKALEDLELIDITPDGIFFSDPVLAYWFKQNF